MSSIISSIVLSSGTVVNIPAFPDLWHGALPQDAIIKTRAGGICFDYFGNILQYNMLSDEEWLELGSLLLDRHDFNVLDKNAPSTSGRRIGFLVWTYSHSDGQYYLHVSLDYEGQTLILDPHQVGNSQSQFYDSEAHYEDDWHNFYDVVRGWNRNASNNALNVRPSSAGIYSLDIASNDGSLPAMTTVSYSVSRISSNIAAYIAEHPDSEVVVIGYDPDSNDDPFIIDDPAGFGGGGGSGEDPDEIEKATIPPLPDLSAVDTGLVTLYTATNAQLQALGGYLWSNLWDIETNFKKLFADPMNCLIGLSIVPVQPTAGGAQNVKFGNINTNIALNVLSSQFVELDCGSVNIKEYIGSFLDYSPYVNISLYLPYIGYRELSPDDVMNDTIHVVYHIDVLSGGCCAMIETGKKGLLYSFNGSCITNVPITAINYSGAIQNAVSAVGAGLTTVAGIATGAAPVAAVGAASMLSSAANTAMNSKPTIQRSGSMGGSAGLMSYQKPLLVITRPRMSVPDKLNKFVGLTTNVTMKLSQVKGFTQVEHVHLSGIAATDDEKDELMTLLRQGVIF